MIDLPAVLWLWLFGRFLACLPATQYAFLRGARLGIEIHVPT